MTSISVVDSVVDSDLTSMFKGTARGGNELVTFVERE